MRRLVGDADVQFAEYLRADEEAAVACELIRDLAGALLPGRRIGVEEIREDVGVDEDPRFPASPQWAASLS